MAETIGAIPFIQPLCQRNYMKDGGSLFSSHA
jgi:hypothetical protein